MAEEQDETLIQPIIREYSLEKFVHEIETTDSSANDSIVAAAVVYLDQIENQEKPVEQDSGPDENKIKLCFDLKQHAFRAGGGVSMKKIMF